MGGSSKVEAHLNGIECPTDDEIDQVGKKVKDAAVKARKTEIQQYYDHQIDQCKGDGITTSDNTTEINRLEDERDEALGKVGSDFDYIPGLYEAWKKPEAYYAAAIRSHLSDVRSSLSSAATEKIDSVETAVSDWHGNAAKQFSQGFLNPFPKSVDNQVEVVDEMVAAVSAYEAIVKNARKDIKDVGDKTAEVLDSLYAWDSKNLTPTLGIIAAVAGVLAALPTGGASLALTLIGGGAAVASNVASVEIKGGTVDDILKKMQENIDAMKDAWKDNEDGLAGAFDESYTEVDGIVHSSDPKQQRDLLPNRPKVADGGGNHDNFQYPAGLK